MHLSSLCSLCLLSQLQEGRTVLSAECCIPVIIYEDTIKVHSRVVGVDGLHNMITNIVFIIKDDMKILEFLWKLGR